MLSAGVRAHGPVSHSARVAPVQRAVPVRALWASGSSRLSRSCRQLQVPRSWRLTQLRRRSMVVAAGPQPLFETAFVLPGMVATLFRAATAGVGIYCYLQWSTFRRTRKQVEEVQADEKVKSAERAERLQRLQPKTSPKNDDAHEE